MVYIAFWLVIVFIEISFRISGVVSVLRRLSSIGILIIKIIRSHNGLIFIIGIKQYICYENNRTITDRHKTKPCAYAWDILYCRIHIEMEKLVVFLKALLLQSHPFWMWSLIFSDTLWANCNWSLLWQCLNCYKTYINHLIIFATMQLYLPTHNLRKVLFKKIAVTSFLDIIQEVLYLPTILGHSSALSPCGHV